MIKILPSLASANPMCLGQEIQSISSLGYLHVDLEDGNFVPNITFGMKTVRSALVLEPQMVCDVHLMVMEPERYLQELSELGIAAVAVHWEAVAYPARLINRIRQMGMRAGIAINPKTSAEEILDYLDQLDYVLVMSSEPDYAGEQFQKSALEKVRLLRKWAPKIEIVVDGGVNQDNIGAVTTAGANTVVLGRALFQAENVEETVSYYRQRGCVNE